MMQCRTNHCEIDAVSPPESIIFGRSAAMATIRRSLLKVADTSIPILIEGESGTGKEVVCKYLHRRSLWGRGPLAKINCPATVGALLEREFVGDEHKGSNGTFAARPGRIEVTGGTLFLDEVSELDLPLQSKLLKLLQDGRVPAAENIRSKPRIVCSTSRNLDREVAAQRFCQDLYYQISGLVLRLPPLRERLEDLDVLVEYFVAFYNDRFECCAPPVPESTLLLMTTHSWGGNIRELENLIKRYVVVGSQEAILSEIVHGDHLSANSLSPNQAVSLGQMTRSALQRMENRIILNSLRANRWNRKRTARALNISYRSLLYKLKKAGIKSRYKDPGLLNVARRSLEDLS